jgi:hypothetical protein
MFSGIVSKTDSCIVGINLVSTSLSFFIRKSSYSIFVEYTHLSSLSLVLYLLHDVSGQISLYVTLTEREPFHGQRSNFVFSPPVSGLPFPLLAPRLSPCSFTGKLY